MTRIEAQVVTPFVLDWLRNKTAVSPQLVRLLHRFDQALNLQDADGTVISLVSPVIGPGPFAVVVPHPFFLQVNAADPIDITNGAIRIGTVQMRLAAATVWQPQPYWRSVSAAQWRAVLPEMRQTTVTGTPLAAGDMHRLLGTWRRRVDPLANAIITNDRLAMETAVIALAGVGEGLTPAGDDVLLGAILALYAGQPRPERLAAHIAAVAASRTTTLSAAWLRAAAAGAAAADWHLLLKGVAQGRGGWETAVARILSRGHTSGAAALCGFTAVLTALLRFR